MNQKTIAAAMLGLAMTGCAHTRKAMPPEGPAPQPVGMQPVPPLHETINRGVANPAVSRSTLPDPANPNWSARPYPPGVLNRGPGPAAATTGAAATAGAQATAAREPSQPPEQLPALNAQASRPEPTSLPRVASSDPAVSPSSTAPPASAPPAGEVIDGSHLPPVGDALDTPESLKPPAADAPALPLPSSTDAPAAAPAASLAPAAPVEALPPGGDPLLGPNPELMPSSLQGTALPEAHAPETGRPAAEPSAAPGPAPTPADLPSLPEASPSPAPGVVEQPDLGPAPTPEPAAGPTSSTLPAPAPAPPTQTLAARPPGPRVDPEVTQASAASAAEDVIDPHWKRAGETAARVGDEVITMRELVVGVREQLRKLGVKPSAVQRDEMNMLAQGVLANLVDRSLIYQEARHELKDKKLDHLLEIADKVWKEEELPSLLRTYGVDGEFQLGRKLEESGRSLAALKTSHRQDFIAMLYMQQKLKDKVVVELPEMLKYYNVHINDKENYRAARITWREMLVETARHPSPAAARRKAEALLARLQKGEDFAKLAKEESDGPSRVKADGGLMETSPGGYGVAAVNQALETLPLKAVSGIIEGPSSFHIVRVEARRPAGPAGFAELQDAIRREIFNDKSSRERRLLLAKLRDHSIVTTIFDGTESDPNTARR